MRGSRWRAPRPAPQQLCLICSIVGGLAAQAERDLLAGRLEAVGEALKEIRAQISGVRQEAREAVLTVPRVP